MSPPLSPLSNLLPLSSALPPSTARAPVDEGAVVEGRPAWSLPELSGRLSELCSTGPSAQLTLVFGLVLDAQRRGEPVAWIMSAAGGFFPPDVADAGVDLDALVVVRAQAGPAPVQRMLLAGDQLARSGAFGLLVLDLVDAGAEAVPMPLLTRLLGLARKHDVAIVFLSRADGPRLGSLISLRAEAHRHAREGGRFACEARAVKDKRRGPGWSYLEVCRGPVGLR